jgi:hypothetical protein
MVEFDTGLGKCDIVLVDVSDEEDNEFRPILPIQVKFKDFESHASVIENTVEQIKSYMTSDWIQYGVATNLMETRVFKKVKGGCGGVCEVLMSPANGEKMMLSAIFFAVIQSIHDYEAYKKLRANGIESERVFKLVTEKPQKHEQPCIIPALKRRTLLSVYNQSCDIEYDNEALFLLGRDVHDKVRIEIDKSCEPIATGRSGQIFLGNVYRSKQCMNNELSSLAHPDEEKFRVAIKICDRSDRKGRGLEDEMCNEARILRYLNKCGVQCAPQLLWTGIFMYSNLFVNATQFIQNGRHVSDLHNLGPRRSELLAQALNELHSVGVHHGDIRPSNIIFVQEDCENEKPEDRCFIIDYGFSTLFTTPRPYVELLAGDNFEELRRNGEFENDKQFLAKEELAPSVEIKLKEFVGDLWLKEVQLYRELNN